MSQKTQASIQLLIDARIADNNSKDISAGDVREVLTAINESFNGPIMIYHGQLKARGSNSGTHVATAKDYYVNLAFFKQQVPGSPTLATNLVKVDTTSVPNTSNGVVTVVLSVGLNLRITVASNVITQLEVLSIEGGLQAGNVTYSLNGTPLTFTYSGVITGLGTGVTTLSRFAISASAGEGDHTTKNTLVQASPISISAVGALMNGMTDVNEMRSYISNPSSADAGEANVTLWRVA
tara:strand:+ start:136 stop:846 length:711 start_codon:yes stop_codon:yes gene_type:complete